MTNLYKTQLKLPEDAAAAIRTLWQHTENLEKRSSYLAALRNQGWTFESIALAVSLTRERVRQIYKLNPVINEELISGLPLPTPPARPEKPKPVYVEPDPTTLARLLELQPLAQQVRSGAAYRAEAEEYTRLINDLHTKQGVTLYRLALRLGVTCGALRYRLVRYGYKTPRTGTSKVYRPIITANRALAE